jgi:hypothetical protein
MKGHPRLNEPRGKMFQVVNALVAQIHRGDRESRVVELLGSPDERNDNEDEKEDEDYQLGFVDPYRPTRTYYFGIRAGVVVNISTVSRSR